MGPESRASVLVLRGSSWARRCPAYPRGHGGRHRPRPAAVTPPREDPAVPTPWPWRLRGPRELHLQHPWRTSLRPVPGVWPPPWGPVATLPLMRQGLRRPIRAPAAGQASEPESCCGDSRGRPPSWLRPGADGRRLATHPGGSAVTAGPWRADSAGQSCQSRRPRCPQRTRQTEGHLASEASSAQNESPFLS